MSDTASLPMPSLALAQTGRPVTQPRLCSSTVQGSKAGQWGALPVELLHAVCAWLPVVDQARARCVCRHWCAAVSRRVTCVNLAAKDPNRGQLARHLPNLTEVHLAFGSQPVSVDAMRRRLQALMPLPIKALHCDLFHLHNTAADLVAAIVEELPSLTALGFKLSKVKSKRGLRDAEDLLHTAAPYLESVHMTAVPLSAGARSEILQALSAVGRLRSVSTFAYGSIVQNDQWNDLHAIGMLTRLTSLELYSNETTGGDLQCLTRLQELQSLCWIGLHGPQYGFSTDAFVAGMRAMLTAMSKLQHLDVRTSEHRSGSYPANVVVPHLSAVKELRSLATAEGFLPSTDNSLQQMPFLTRLLVWCCNSLKDCLPGLASLTGLKALDLDSHGIPEFVSACLPSLRNLEQLKLKLTGNFLKPEEASDGPLPLLPHLTRLQLSACWYYPEQKSGKCLLTIGNNLPALRHLIVEAWNVSTDSVRALVRCPELEVVKHSADMDETAARALIAEVTVALTRLRLLEFPRLSHAMQVFAHHVLANRHGNMRRAYLIDLVPDEMSQIRVDCI